MARFSVGITERIFPSLELEFARLNAIDASAFVCTSKTPEGLISELRDVDAILNGYVQLTKPIIDSLSKCKIIVRCGIGVNNVDLAAASARKIIVTNVPDYCISEVSDHALGLIIALARKIIKVNTQVKGGHWSFSTARPIHRIAGKTLGLVGFGNIARALAEKGLALNLRVIYYDPYFQCGPDFPASACETLDELLAQSDFVSVHTPLTPETAGLIGLPQLRTMKPTAFLVNTSRGGVIKEADLAVALRENLIAGAGLDVLADEKNVTENPLLSFDNVIVTAHSAYYSEESTEELRTRAVEEIVAVLSGRSPRRQVNSF